jgi:hypothetical protein
MVLRSGNFSIISIVSFVRDYRRQRRSEVQVADDGAVEPGLEGVNGIAHLCLIPMSVVDADDARRNCSPPLSTENAFPSMR